MALPVTITGLSTAVAPVGPFKATVPVWKTGSGPVGGQTVGRTAGSAVPEMQGQSFLATAAHASLSTITCYFNKTATAPTDGIIVEIRSGSISGTVLATSNTIPAASIPTSPTVAAIAVVFPTPPALSVGTTYYVVWRRSGTTSDTAYYNVFASSDSSYPDGQRTAYVSGSWIAYSTSIDIFFSVGTTDAFYFVGVDSASSATLKAFKATDPTTAWTPISLTFGIGAAIVNLTAFQVGSTIHLLTSSGTTTATYKYCTFDASVDTWGLSGSSETIASAVVTAGTTGSQFGCSFIVRSNGEVVAFFNGTASKTSGTTYSRVHYSRRTAVNTWSAATQVDAAAASDNLLPEAVLGASDSVHFLWKAGSVSLNVTQRSLSAANALGTASVTNNVFVNGQDAIQGASYLRAAVTKVVFGRNCGSTALATGYFDSTVPAGIQAATAIATGGSLPRYFVDGTDVWALYLGGGGDLFVQKSTTDGATFAGEISAFTGTVAVNIANLSIDATIYQRGAAFVIPYIVNDAGTWKYNEYVVRVLNTPDAWNVADKDANVTLTNADKTATVSIASSGNYGVRSSTANPNGTAGKYYAEFLYSNNASNVMNVGIKTSSATLVGSAEACRLGSDGNIYMGGGALGNVGGTLTTGDVVCMSYDAGAERIWFRKNGGLWNNNSSADPASGTNSIDVSAIPNTPTCLYFIGSNNGDSITVRTRVADLTLTAPAGFKSWMGEIIPTADAWNVTDKSANITLSQGDKMAATTSASVSTVRSTKSWMNGAAAKLYVEFYMASTSTVPQYIGLEPLSVGLTTLNNCISIYTGDGTINFAVSTTLGSIGKAIQPLDTLGMAWDSGAERIWFRCFGDWNNDPSANPATGVGGLDASAAAAELYALFSYHGSLTSIAVHTTKADLTQTAPAGFTSWMGETLVVPDMGTLASGVAAVAGSGASNSTGTGALAAVGSTGQRGAGVSSSSGTAALVDAVSALAGAGKNGWSGTAALVAGVAAVSGTGSVVNAPTTGTGTLAAQRSTLVTGGAATVPAQTGSNLDFPFDSSAQSGTISSTITVPSDAQMVVVGLSSYANTDKSHDGIYFTKGSVQTKMSYIDQGDMSHNWEVALFYLNAPDTGTNKSLTFSYPGNTQTDSRHVYSVTYWKGIDTAAPVRDSDGINGSSWPQDTPLMTALATDKVIGFAGYWYAGGDGNGHITAWNNLNPLAETLNQNNAHGAWATIDVTDPLLKTLYTIIPSGQATTDDDGASWRMVVPVNGGGTQVRVTFRGQGAWSTLHCSVGVRSGTSGTDTVATPVELKFGGASGFSVASGVSIVSDFAALNFSSGDALVIITDNGADHALASYWNGVPPGVYFGYKASTQSWNLTSGSGFNLAANQGVGVTLVESDTVSGLISVGIRNSTGSEGGIAALVLKGTAGAAGVSSSTGTGVLAAVSSTGQRGVGVASSVGTSVLVAQAHTLASLGTSQWISTGALGATAATLAGVGVAGSVGTGVLAAASSTGQRGAGLSSSTGTAALLSTTSTLAGSGGAILNVTGSGALTSTTVSLAGVGVSQSSGPSSLLASSAATVAAGVSQSSGAAVLSSAISSLTGLGSVGSFGTATLSGQAPTLTGTGVARWTATGVLTPSGASVVSIGSGQWVGLGTLTTGVATVAAAGRSSSQAVNAALQASLASLSGFEGVTLISGTGGLPSQSSQASGAGVVRAVGTGTLAANGIVASGAGVSSTQGFAALSAQGSKVAASGQGTVTGSGTLPASVSILTGSGGAIALVTGTGVLDAGTSSLTGAANSRWIATGAVNAAVSALTGSGASLSFGTAPLLASRAGVYGYEGVALISGSGALQARSSGQIGAGLSRSFGTGSLIVADSCEVIGSLVSGSVGTGVLASSPSQVLASGKTDVQGTGALASRSSTLFGAASLTASGSGELVAQDHRIVGPGRSGSTGIGSLIDKVSHQLNAVGISGAVGAGVLAVKYRAYLQGVGTVTHVGHGDLIAQVARIDGSDFELPVVVGNGALACGQSSLEGRTAADVVWGQPLPSSYPGASQWSRGGTTTWHGGGTSVWRNPGTATWRKAA